MRVLVFLLALAPAVLAAEPQADPLTLHLPADAIMVVRLAPPARFDTIGGESGLAGVMEERRPFGDAVLSAIATTAFIDRSKPLYWAMGPGGPVTLLAAAAGTTAQQVEALGRGHQRFGLLPDGWIRVSEEAAPAEGTVPLALLPGDVSLVVPVARLVEQHRAKLTEALRNLDSLDAMARKQRVPVPPVALKLVRILAGRVLAALPDVTDVHYALSWRDGRLESEGWIRTREGSALRRWLDQRAGGKPNDLMGLLPSRAFWSVESCGTSAGLDGDVAALLDEALGKGAGRSLLLLLSPSYALHEHLTGHAAGVITVQGMMAMSMRAVHEVRPGSGIAEAIAAIDAAAVNRLLAGLGLPVDVKLERDYARSGETAIHRLTYMSPDPQLAMFGSQMQTCFAVEGGYLLVVQSGFAENDLRALILRVRAGERTEHPHAKAMARLMPDRQEGLSLNVGALKPVFGLFAMAVPDGAKVVNAFPDDLVFSTALAVQGGHVHLRGDWPLKDCLDFVATLKRMDR